MRTKKQHGQLVRHLSDSHGLSTVEYVIVLILIAVVGIAAWRTFGQTVVSKVNSGNSQVSGMGGP